MKIKKANNKKKVKAEKKVKKNKKNFIKEIFLVNGKFDFLSLIKNILLPVIGGLAISSLTKGGMAAYATIKKSPLTPPAIVFPIVWTILYILMGLAAYRIYMNNKAGKNDRNGYFYYLIQLLINFFWSIVFFNFRLYGISFILIIVLLVMVIITTIKFYKVDKISAYLMIPYILWISFASYLTFYIWMYNEM